MRHNGQAPSQPSKPPNSHPDHRSFHPLTASSSSSMPLHPLLPKQAPPGSPGQGKSPNGSAPQPAAVDSRHPHGLPASPWSPRAIRRPHLAGGRGFLMSSVTTSSWAKAKGRALNPRFRPRRGGPSRARLVRKVHLPAADLPPAGGLGRQRGRVAGWHIFGVTTGCPLRVSRATGWRRV